MLSCFAVRRLEPASYFVTYFFHIFLHGIFSIKPNFLGRIFEVFGNPVESDKHRVF